MNSDLTHLSDPVVRARVGVLTQLNVKPNDRAKIADIEVGDLPEYVGGLVALNLLDKGGRLTTDGAVYVNVALGKGSVYAPWLTRRDIWRRVGGDEPRLDVVLQNLIDRGLIELNASANAYHVLQASAA